MVHCKNCNNEVYQNYCPNCGQPAKLKRIDRHYIQHEIEHVLHFEKGIFYTIKELLIRPGDNVRKFILDNRSRLIKPVIFIIISSLIYTLVNHFFGIDDGYIKVSDIESITIPVIFEWIQNHYGYANIIMGIFIALWLKLFFLKSPYNLFEILILLCFVIGTEMLLFSVFTIVEGLTKIPLMQISGIIGLFYSFWAIGQFFDEHKILSYFKAVAGYILGMITFVFSAILLGLLVDLLVQH